MATVAETKLMKCLWETTQVNRFWDARQSHKQKYLSNYQWQSEKRSHDKQYHPNWAVGTKDTRASVAQPWEDCWAWLTSTARDARMGWGQYTKSSNDKHGTGGVTGNYLKTGKDVLCNSLPLFETQQTDSPFFIIQYAQDRIYRQHTI